MRNRSVRPIVRQGDGDAMSYEPTEWDWLNDAACKQSGLDADAWFPYRTLDIAHREAIKICGGCPIRDRCANLRQPEDEGIWGGVWWPAHKVPRNITIERQLALLTEPPSNIEHEVAS